MAKIMNVEKEFFAHDGIVYTIVRYESGRISEYIEGNEPKTVKAWMEKNGVKPYEMNDIEKEIYTEKEIERNPFGVVACMESVKSHIETLHEDPLKLLADFRKRAEEDVFFNKTMIDALEKYMEEHGITEEEEKEEMTAEQKREAKKEAREAIDKAIEAYKGTDRPSEAVQMLVESVGYEEAKKIIATLVNAVSLYDGRIYEKTRTWANSVTAAPTNGQLRDMGIYGVDSWIHSAHVDQLGEAMRKYEPPQEEPEDLTQIEEEEIEDVTDVIAEFSESTEYAEYICDYGSSEYICDAFTYIADDNTSIYYSDIIDFISKNVEMVGDTISEFGWDGCGSDLYKAGQMAEFRSIETELNENIVDVLKVYAFNYYREQYGEHVRTETRERISNHIDDHWGDFDTLGDIEDIVNEYANC